MKHAIIKEPAGHDRTDRVLIIISVICGLIAVAALSSCRIVNRTRRHERDNRRWKHRHQ